MRLAPIIRTKNTYGDLSSVKSSFIKYPIWVHTKNKPNTVRVTLNAINCALFTVGMIPYQEYISKYLNLFMNGKSFSFVSGAHQYGKYTK